MPLQKLANLFTGSRFWVCVLAVVLVLCIVLFVLLTCRSYSRGKCNVVR